MKDDDVDIVAWIPFGDSRPSQLMLFVQCAAGRTDWRSKTTTLALDLWQDYIDWTLDASQDITQLRIPMKLAAYPGKSASARRLGLKATPKRA